VEAAADGAAEGSTMHGIMSRLSSLACTCTLLVLVYQGSAAAQHPAQRTYATPQEAVQALIAAANAGNLDELLAIFGPDAKDLLGSSDPATARKNREVFSVAVAERWRLSDDTPTRKTLVIGNEDWPFPVPLAKDAAGWRFDTAAGKEEVIARRIGRNELEAIQTSLAYVTAQFRYAQAGHDGQPAGRYATKFRSDPGKENGLYWPTAHGQKRSPLGDLVAEAAPGGPATGADSGKPLPLHGYYFKILTSKGGFGLVAWPAQYDVTGVMTFLVNQEGVVREKDLGPGTEAAVRRMSTHNPDASWRRSE
jgi:hypothetical protein